MEQTTALHIRGSVKLFDDVKTQIKAHQDTLEKLRQDKDVVQRDFERHRAQVLENKEEMQAYSARLSELTKSLQKLRSDHHDLTEELGDEEPIDLAVLNAERQVSSIVI